MPAAGEYLAPPVDGGALLLEHDEPLLEEAEAALLRGGVVALEVLCKDGPADVDGGASILELPHVGGESCAIPN